MWSHMGLLPQCLCIVRSRAKVDRLEESYVSRAGQCLLWARTGCTPCSEADIQNSRLKCFRSRVYVSALTWSWCRVN